MKNTPNTSPWAPNLYWLTALVVVESLQVLIAAIYFNTFFPPTSALQGQILPEWIQDLKPEREGTLYHLFIFTALVLETLAVYRFKSRLLDVAWGRRLRRFLAVESLVTGLLCYVVFKILVYHHPYLTGFFWPVLLVLAAAIKIFWRPLGRAWKSLMAFLHDPANGPGLRMLGDMAVPVFIFLLIYIPNQEGVLAQDYMVEQFHHFDTLIMVPAFASSMGCVLNVDVNSQYGIGMPMAVGFLAKCLGGVTYQHVLFLLIVGCILYYWLCYMFLRAWLKNVLLSAIAIVIGLKWQMFDSGMSPSVFIIPNGVAVRFFWDVLFFMLVWRHIQRQESWTLALAAVVAGGSLVWVSDTGSYLILAFYAYVFYLLLAGYFLKGPRAQDPGPRDGFLGTIWTLFIPPCAALGLFWLTVGPAIFHPEFWSNVKEFFQFFQDGYESLAVYHSLENHEYLQSLVSFIIPAVYALTFLSVGTLIFLKKIHPENAMALVLSAYGLASYHYYLNRSASTSYYVQCLPYVFILGYWIKCALPLLTPRSGRNLLLALLAFCIFALATTHQFLVYPGMLNMHHNPITDPLARPREQGQKYLFDHLFTRIPEELKLPVNSLGNTDEGWKTEDDFKSDDDLVEFYHKDFDFPQDAALIDRLVPPGGRAAVISSFDIKLLMQADRKPFFYCFPLLVERPMRMRNFPSTHLHTVARLQRTIRQMEEEKPEYIFMEKIFLLNNQVTKYFYIWSQDVILLDNYVGAHYEPYMQGYYLVAMKRKR